MKSYFASLVIVFMLGILSYSQTSFATNCKVNNCENFPIVTEIEGIYFPLSLMQKRQNLKPTNDNYYIYHSVYVPTYANIFYEMKKQRKNKSNKRVNLINAVIRYFGMNVLISKMKEWPKDTSWIWKERMLQLILRAEVDKNREAKRLKQTRQQKNQNH